MKERINRADGSVATHFGVAADLHRKSPSNGKEMFEKEKRSSDGTGDMGNAVIHGKEEPHAG